MITPLHLFADTSNVAKSGQTISYATGDDGDLQMGVTWPTPRFIDNENGTITDTVTSLIWLRDADCFGNTAWSDALEQAQTLKNGDCNLTDESLVGDWRIPSIRELESLMHSGVFEPAVAGTVDPDDPFQSLQLEDYWSSTSNSAAPEEAFSLSIQFGHVLSRAKNVVRRALFVRTPIDGSPVAEVYATGQAQCYDSVGAAIDCQGTGQDGELRTGMSLPTPRFTDAGDGTIRDNLTGLSWLKDAECWGLGDWSDGVRLANNLANGECGLTDDSLAGDWRLPNRKELVSLINYGNSAPALTDTNGDGQWSNNDPFINVQPTSGYWSSTTYFPFTNNAWYIDFLLGVIGETSKGNLAYIWPVRQSVLTYTLEVVLTGDGSGTVTSSPDGLFCPEQCAADIARDTTVTLTAKADNTSRFEGWSLANCSKNRQCTMTLTESTSVSAAFSRNSTAVSTWMILLTN